MKKVTDFLQSRPREGRTSFEILGVKFEDVMKLPIEYLELTGMAKRLFVDNSIKLSSTHTKSLKTLGDLVNFGFDNVEYYLMKKLESGINYDRELYKIQAALAKFSLKLFDTDFSVYDIEVDDLNVTEDALRFLKKRKVAELSQLALNEEYYLSNFKVDDNKVEIIRSVEAAMREFGVKTKHLLRKLGIDEENQSENAQTGEKVSPIFPKIVPSLEKYNAFLEEQSGKQPEAKVKLPLSGIVNAPLIPPIDFSGKDFDYTKLINLINSHYTELKKFLADAKMTAYYFSRIPEGKYLDQDILYSLTTLFNCQIKDLLTKNPVKVITTQNEDGYIYDFSKLVQAILTTFGNYNNFREKTGASSDTITRLTKGLPMRSETIKHLCALTGCKPKEVVYISKWPEPAPTNEQDIPDVDYSNLKLILKQKFTTLYDICKALNLNYQNIALRISRGKHLNPGILSAIANYLSLNPTDLVKINRTIGEVQDTANLNKRKIPANYSYEKLMLRIKRFYPNMDFESFAQKIKLNLVTIKRIERGWPISEKEMEKIARNLFCSPSEIFAPINGSDPKVFEEKTLEYDYTNLLRKIDNEYESLRDFELKNDFSPDTMQRVVENQPLSYITLARFMKVFNCELDEILTLRDKELRKQLIEKIKVYFADRAEEKSQVDYSKLFKILKDKKINKKEFLLATKLSSMVWEYMTLNRQISVNSLRKICEYLGCSISDICEEKHSTILKEIPTYENSICDYTGLYKILNERLISLSTLIAQTKIPKNYTTRIRLGFELNDDYISRICAALNCTKEDIVVYHPENSLKFSVIRKNHRKRKSKARPAQSEKLLTGEVSSEETQDAVETENPPIDSQKGAEKLTTSIGTKPKFYFDDRGRGYINLGLEKVKTHFEKLNQSGYSFE